jgi:hypothetical protein
VYDHAVLEVKKDSEGVTHRKKLSSIAVAMLAICLLAVPRASAQGEKTGKAEAGSADAQIKARLQPS